MKLLSIFLTTITLVALNAGCGKDNKSGGATANTPFFDHLNLGASETRLKSWYVSNQEGLYPGDIGARTENRVVKTYSQTDGCEQKPISVFGINLGSVNYCFNSIKLLKTETKTIQVNILPNTVKSSNPILKSIFSSSGMTLVKVIEKVTESAFGSYSYFFIEFVKSNGHRVVYEIDTYVHSALNPVKITDSETKTVEALSYKPIFLFI